MNPKYRKLFEPISIGKCKIENRFVMAPMGPLGLGDTDGAFNQRGIEYYGERAKGGTGLITTGVTFVDNEVEGHVMPSSPSPVYMPMHFIRTGTELTEKVHAYRSKIFLQLSAGFGRVLPPGALGDFASVAPSAVMNRWADVPCRPLEKEEVRKLVKQFGRSASIAKSAGFDGVQIHAVHEGYLLDQFALALFNQRTDEYGGSLENRLRFAREIVEEIKTQCGDDYPVSLRYSLKSFIKDLRKGALPGEQFEEKGRDIEEGIEAAIMLESYGYDAFDVDVGSYDSWWWSHPPMYMEKGMYRPYAKIVKEHVSVPVICAGRMDDPDMALQALEQGETDMIGLGRPLLADPDYVNKLKAGKTADIRPCISCHEGCMGRMQKCMLVNCAVNPQAAREREMELRPILKPKRVLIIGGGVAGCEAARVLALRGHKPELYEARSRLGGNLIPGGSPEFKEDDIALANWYAHTLEQLEVPVHLNHKLTKEEILAEKADDIIIATGSTPKKFTLGDGDRVFTADKVLLGEADPGETVAVIGGGLVGCETALWLARNGRKVTIVEALDKVMAINGPSCSSNKEMLDALLVYNNIGILTGAKAKAFADRILTVETSAGETAIDCDSVVLAVGYNENNNLYHQLEFEVPSIHLIGDANKVGNIMYGIWDAFEVSNHI